MVYVVLLELKETVYRDVVELYTLKKKMAITTYTLIEN